MSLKFKLGCVKGPMSQLEFNRMTKEFNEKGEIPFSVVGDRRERRERIKNKENKCVTEEPSSQKE